MITDMIAMPDVQIVCVSSSEYDLRFYDTAANKFNLRLRVCYVVKLFNEIKYYFNLKKLVFIQIYSFKNTIVCMGYYFGRNIKDASCIVLGDTSGSVIVIAFNPIDRGPFKQQPAKDILEIHYDNVLQVLIFSCF